MKKIFSFLKNNKGFSLIEAVVTVAIVGIVVTPIAMVFSGSYSMTLKSKEQFKVNEIAQSYTEFMKSKSYVELKTFVDDINNHLGGDLNGTEGVTYGLSDLPDGVTVKVSYDLNNSVLKTSQNTIPNTAANAISADFILYIDNDTTATTNVQYPNGNLMGTMSSNAGLNREINIKYEANDTETITQTGGSYKDDAGLPLAKSEFAIIHSLAAPTYNILINCNDLQLDASHIGTKISIDNRTTETVNVYIAQDSKDIIDPTIAILGNNVSILDNYMVIPSASQRIYTITTEIYKQGVLVGKYSTTKLNE